MSSFYSFSTSDPNTGNQPLAAGNTLDATGTPFMTGTAAKIVGSVASDQSGTLQILQSMAYTPVAPTSGLPQPTIYWDVVSSFNLTGGTPLTIDQDIIGPVAAIKFTNTSGSNQSYLRIFLRATGNRAAS